MLPPEILTLTILAVTCRAFPQIEQATNRTSLLTGPSSTTEVIHGVQWIIPSIPTADGFETDEPSWVTNNVQALEVVTTSLPLVINIQVNAEPQNTPSPSGDSHPKMDENDGRKSEAKSATALAQAPVPVAAPPAAPPPPASAARTHSLPVANSPSIPTQAPVENNLFNEVILRMNDNQQPGPSNQVVEGTAVGGTAAQPGQVTSPPTVPQPAPTTGKPVLTAGSTTVVLTPGLSTTLGTGTDATFIAISTDAEGYTLVTISSSRMAITGRVTVAPATLTLSRSEPGASVTPTPTSRPVDLEPSVAGRAAATSSKNAAADKTPSSGRQWQVLLGLLWAVKHLLG